MQQKLSDAVEYIGSPLELDFSEAFQQKHIIVLDTKTLDTEYVINDFSPKHLIIKESELDQYDLTGNFVKVIVDDITSTDIIDMKNKSVKEKKCATIQFEAKSSKKEDKTATVNISDGLDGWLTAQEPTIKERKLSVDKLRTIAEDIIRGLQ